MCGIAGIVGADRSEIGRMLSRLSHRGPDARGELDLASMSTSLAHARFSILDLDARSNQPFVSPCGRWALVFNGEIYNYLELKHRLELEGVAFRTTSDTEVLLHWLIRNGRDGLLELDGMYAFALADRTRRTLLLARDPFGEKPLYYALPSGTDRVRFAFASEIKALLAVAGVDQSLDPDALSDYLRFLYTAAPHTLYRGIRELVPGSTLEIAVDEPRDDVELFYDLERRVGAFDGSYRDAVQLFRTRFFESVGLRLRSDVSVGVYLSGGLDSNSILGAARVLSPASQLNTFTARYDGSRAARAVDESKRAARAAQHQRVPHYVIPFENDDDFQASLERMVDLFDQPFGNATAVVADKIAARAAVMSRVCLVGDGGDEILVGYPRYKALLLHRRMQSLPPALRTLARRVTASLPESGRFATRARHVKDFAASLERPPAESFLGWSTYLDDADLEHALGSRGPTRLHGDLLALFERNQADPIRAAALVDFRSFVPFNLMQAADRTGMAHPLEMRCPFLSTRLVEATLAIPTRYKVAAGRTKPLLSDALEGVIPPFVANRRKRAFNPPMQSYVRAHLDVLERWILGAESRTAGLVARPFVQGEVDAFREGRRDNGTFLWGLASLECWLRRTQGATRAPLARASEVPTLLRGATAHARVEPAA